LRDYRLPTDH